MNYYELSFTYTSPIEKEIINDVLAAELGKIGFESFTESEKGLLGYISEALYDKKTLDDKLADFPLENTRIDYISKWVESKDWNEEWRKIISNRSGSETSALSVPPSTRRSPAIHII